MKAPRLQTGTGTLGRFRRERPLVMMTLRDDGHNNDGEPIVRHWCDMSASEARQLAKRLLATADRAEKLKAGQA